MKSEIRSSNPDFCGPAHFTRRSALQAVGLSGAAWLTLFGDLLAAEAERKKQRGKSLILLWLAGAPSQLETFDPHPGSPIAYGTTSIPTAVPGIELASSLEQTAGMMEEISLLRSVVSREGDHERASYNIKTGYRPIPALEHPSIGAVVCHELPSPLVEIPTHVSILPNQWPARGGYLGAQFDAFKIGDPTKPLPDMRARTKDQRTERRLKSLSVVEAAFAKGRHPDIETKKTLHVATVKKARRMMSSEQLKAFDVSEEPADVREAYGNTPFGRGCLAARRLVEAGVRCVEVTLNGWDTHINNHEQQAARAAILDPAFATLIRELKQRDLLDSTVVLCGGEFGRTPKLNGLDGRDHWPHGFSLALAGGGMAGGRVVGATDPSGEKKEPERPVKVADVHATIQTALGIDPEFELMTPAERPLALSEGRVVRELL